ncbi:MAG: hypothetical protein LBU39_07630 [Desulfobulbaceae bacterium]|jgi:hypothetical protein|nr:hypothetical protein [Desulfobulbaceae bacterium]
MGSQQQTDSVQAQPAAKPLPKNQLFAIITWLLDWNFIPYGVKKVF